MDIASSILFECVGILCISNFLIGYERVGAASAENQVGISKRHLHCKLESTTFRSLMVFFQGDARYPSRTRAMYW